MKKNLFALALFPALSPLVQASGPGLPNVSYPTRFSVLSSFTSTNKAPRGHGFVAMHDGYLFMPFSNDGGGGGGSGGFTFFNIANPSAPVPVFSTLNSAAYSQSTGAHYAGNVREPHGFTIANGIACLTMNNAPGPKSGLQFWDFRDIDGSVAGAPDAPLKIAELPLSTLTRGDYDNTAWWVAWQGGRYAYVAGTNAGLFIVDASDPANPVELKRIPTGQLGGFRVNVVHVLGNLMVLSNANNVSGVATFDISDPLNPQVLDVEAGIPAGYSSLLNNNRIFIAGDPVRVLSIADPANITVESVAPDVASTGGYGVYQDGHFILGSSNAMVDFDLSTSPPTSNGVFTPPGFSNADWDFTTALGNLVFMGNDHSQGSVLVANSTAPDTTPPVVTMVNPVNGATGQAVTSRVGLAFSDMLDTASVEDGGIVIRPVGGAAIAGRFSHQLGLVNFWPDQPLIAGVTYEVVVNVGGVKDAAGNANTASFQSTFTTAPGSLDFAVELAGSGPAPVGQTVTFTASSEEESLEFSFDFADGSPATAFSSSPSATHTFTSPGNRTVVVTARKEDVQRTATRMQVTHLPLPVGSSRPTRSSTLAFDEARGRVWNVNPDHASVAAIDLATFARLHEVTVGAHPAALAVAGDRVWVACRDTDSVAVLDAANGALLSTLQIGYGARPVGICPTPDGTRLFVACEGSHEVVEINVAAGTVGRRLALDGPPRGLAVSADGADLFATRFISPDDAGKVVEIDTAAFTARQTIDLSFDPGPDTEDSARGLPNYLFDASISPDGSALWVSSKKDNIARGMAREGTALTFDSTVRSIISAIDLGSGAAQDDLARRIDFNERGFPAAAAFSPLGNLGFAVSLPTNRIEVFDPYLGEALFSIPSAGLAPMGVAINASGNRMCVFNYMSRTVAIFPVSVLCGGHCFVTTPLAVVGTISAEVLPANVLLGKQLFYNADDPRLNLNTYMACASCHFDGDSDGRVWDFTQMGEGLRNTTSLHHVAGRGFGMIHWSGNFDEGQDFENQIRTLNAGTGLMSNADFAQTSTPLGAPKAGRSADLDALAAYMESLENIPKSPHRQSDGSLTSAGLRGREIFNRLQCFDCHSGPAFSDSRSRVLHDVGTLATAETVAGIDTPTLAGIWNTAPYLHDGSAANLGELLTRHAPNAGLSTAESSDLVAYLLQIDASEPPPEMPPRAYFRNISARQGGAPGTAIVEGAGDDEAIASVQFFTDAGTLGTDASPPFSITLPANATQVSARVTFTDGSVATLLGGTFSPVTDSTPVKINFQPPGSTTPSGYLADESQTFGPRGTTGLSYGWNAAFNETRIRNINPDPRYDTLNHMQKNGTRIWEIGLPAGAYRVRAVSGDAGFDDGFHHLVAEAGGPNQVTILNGSPAGVFFVEGESVVNVTDGRLTLSPGSSASNTKICFVDITPMVSSMTLTASGSTVSEWPQTSAMLTVTAANGASAADRTIRLGYAGSADPLADFDAAPPASVVLPAGQSSVSFTLTPRVDALPELTETLLVNIVPGVGIEAGTPSAVEITVLDRPFDAWRADRFTRAESRSGEFTSPAMDEDGDGHPLLLEYALGGDPFAADAFANPLRIEIGDGEKLIGIARPTGGVADVGYRLEVSPDLDDWTDRTDEFESFSDPLGGGREMLWFAYPNDDEPRIFYRLGIED